MIRRPKQTDHRLNGRSGDATLLLAVLLFAVPPASSSELSAILELSRVSPPARVAFREERHNPMFESPLLLQGYLEYIGPGALQKVIESPFQETYSIEAGAISMHRDGETRRLPVSKNKSLEAMLNAFEGILSGDTERLETVFDYEVIMEAADWTIKLHPKSRRIGKQLTGIRICGNDDGVRTIMIDLLDGERHILHIRHEEPMP